MSEKLEELRSLCEKDLATFIRVVAPYAVMGQVHEDVCTFLQDRGPYKLVMLPRGHRKSFLTGMYTVWQICRNPAITILYLSATSELAESQLRLIKQTLESEWVRKLWKNLINTDEGKRAQWSSTDIKVDHPIRIKEGIRDSTVKAAGLTTNTTGQHYDLIVLDDIVVPDNNTEVGRKLVAERYSQLHSLLNPSGRIIAAGTRYSPKDLYGILMTTEEDIYNREGEFVGTKPQWVVFERVVEKDGEFLWARQKRKDGKYFGFDNKELARIKAGYIDISQFYAQYYNDPNMGGTSGISKELFLYYNTDSLKVNAGNWTVGNKQPMNIFAAIDFAYTLSKRADSTTIVVIGIDSLKNYYVLDIDRFKTDEIQKYFKHIIALHNKWHFKKLYAECTAAQSVIVKSLKQKLSDYNVRLPIEEGKPISKKQERIYVTLKPLYEDGKIYHYRGGNCELLEEELINTQSQHDDIKDALSSAISIAVAPTATTYNARTTEPLQYSRFGGY